MATQARSTPSPILSIERKKLVETAQISPREELSQCDEKAQDVRARFVMYARTASSLVCTSLVPNEHTDEVKPVLALRPQRQDTIRRNSESNSVYSLISSNSTRAKSSGVSTPGGIASGASLTATDSPFSNSRSCSSDSEISAGVCARVEKRRSVTAR